MSRNHRIYSNDTIEIQAQDWPSLVSRLCLLVFGMISFWSCDRSPYSGSANFDCGEGDRILVTERLFCVYTSPHQDFSRGEDGGVVIPPSPLPECPEVLPFAHAYETLTLCSSDTELDPRVIEAAVVAWVTEYTEADADASLDAGSMRGPQSANQGGITLEVLDLGTP